MRFSLFLLLFISFSVSAQIIPEFASPKIPTVPQLRTSGNLHSPNKSIFDNASEAHQKRLNASNYYIDKSQMTYEDELKALREAEILRRQAMRDAYGFSEFPKVIQYDFPKQSLKPSSAHYQKAFEELTDMLEGKAPLDLKKAIHAVENAYYKNTLPFEDFDGAIKARANLIYKRLGKKRHEKRHRQEMGIKQVHVRYFGNNRFCR